MSTVYQVQSQDSFGQWVTDYVAPRDEDAEFPTLEEAITAVRQLEADLGWRGMRVAQIDRDEDGDELSESGVWYGAEEDDEDDKDDGL